MAGISPPYIYNFIFLYLFNYNVIPYREGIMKNSHISRECVNVKIYVKEERTYVLYTTGTDNNWW